MDNKKQSLLVARDMFPQATLEQLLEMAQKIEDSGYFDTPDEKVSSGTNQNVPPAKLWGYQTDLREIINNESHLLIYGSRQIGLSTTLLDTVIKAFEQSQGGRTALVLNKFGTLQSRLTSAKAITGRDISKDNFSCVDGKASSLHFTTFKNLYDLEEVYDTVVIDDAGFIPWGMADGISEKLRRANKVILGSTGSTQAGLFYDLWTTDPAYRKHFIPYYLHPERGNAFAERMIENIGKEAFEEQYLCKFRPVKD